MFSQQICVEHLLRARGLAGTGIPASNASMIPALMAFIASPGVCVGAGANLKQLEGWFTVLPDTPFLIKGAQAPSLL